MSTYTTTRRRFAAGDRTRGRARGVTTRGICPGEPRSHREPYHHPRARRHTTRPRGGKTMAPAGQPSRVAARRAKTSQAAAGRRLRGDSRPHLRDSLQLLLLPAVSWVRICCTLSRGAQFCLAQGERTTCRGLLSPHAAFTKVHL